MQTAVDTIQTAFDTIQSYKLKVRIRNDLRRSGESNLVTSISSCTSRSSSLIALHKVCRYSLVFHSWKRIFTPSINQIRLLLAKNTMSELTDIARQTRCNISIQSGSFSNA